MLPRNALPADAKAHAPNNFIVHLAAIAQLESSNVRHWKHFLLLLRSPLLASALLLALSSERGDGQSDGGALSTAQGARNFARSCDELAKAVEVITFTNAPARERGIKGECGEADGAGVHGRIGGEKLGKAREEIGQGPKSDMVLAGPPQLSRSQKIDMGGISSA